ncbi:MAG: hypothetical protein FJ308_13895 [Planctomycetes bacterium]|nr:hypothetical protein [Planctomycetota bacterium]
MRMNRKTLTLIAASLCGAGTSAMGQDDSRFAARSNVGRIGDSGAQNDVANIAVPSLSDNGSAGRLTDQSSASQIASPSDVASDAGLAPGSVGSEGDLPVATTNAPADSASKLGSTISSAECNTSCAPTSASRGGLGWADFDTLLWWGRSQTNSPVILGGNSPNALPTNAIGGGLNHPVGNDLLVGLRANLGFWLDDCENYGFGGRAWGMLSNGTNQTFTNGGNSTGIGFFNTSLNQPDAYVVNLDRGVFGANTGTITVANEIDAFSGELYGRALLIGDRNNRTDLIGGYTFLRLDSGYSLSSSVLDGWTDTPPPVGTVTSITDQFSTKNTFHGGHIGLMNDLRRGRVGFSLLGKIAMGDMESTSIISGTFSQVPPPPAVPDYQNRGLFAQNSNIGSITRNSFTFIPEMNARMRYQLGRAQLGVGYSLIVLPQVAMATSQIDPNIDALAIPTQTTTTPLPNFNLESYFLHGLDLGVSFAF